MIILTDQGNKRKERKKINKDHSSINELIAKIEVRF
jgi:hypothetical protein